MVEKSKIFYVKEKNMFNWLKRLFCNPRCQCYTLIEVLYDVEPWYKTQKRKYVKSGKYVGKNKKKGKK